MNKIQKPNFFYISSNSMAALVGGILAVEMFRYMVLWKNTLIWTTAKETGYIALVSFHSAKLYIQIILVMKNPVK